MYPGYECTGEQATGPWSFWVTVGFSAIVGAAFLLVRLIIVGAFAVVALRDNPNLDMSQLRGILSTNGLFWTMKALLVGPPVIG